MRINQLISQNNFKQQIHQHYQDQHIVHYGALLDEAKAAVIMLHGRGSSAQDILSLAYEIDISKILYFAPQAKNNTWYPYSFLSPLQKNEPELSFSLAVIDTIVEMLKQKGLSYEQIYLFGFSQGASLSLEYAARNPRKYGCIFALSGGLIGDVLDVNNYKGDFEGYEIFLGCSDADPHIPLSRINETEDVLKKFGANVTKQIY